MSGGAGFNSNQAGWQRLEEAKHLSSSELRAESDRSRDSGPVNLRYVLRQTAPDGRYLFRLPAP